MEDICISICIIANMGETSCHIVAYMIIKSIAEARDAIRKLAIIEVADIGTDLCSLRTI